MRWAGYGERCEERVNRRSGYRSREWGLCGRRARRVSGGGSSRSRSWRRSMAVTPWAAR
jgi:hypothetical protein